MAVSEMGNEVVYSNQSCWGNVLFLSVEKSPMRIYVFVEAREHPSNFYLFLSVQSLKLRVSSFWRVY